MVADSHQLSRAALRGMAEYAGLDFDEARLERILPRLERYLADIGELDQADLATAEPAFISQAGELDD